MRPSGVAARPCIILPPPRSITLPNRASPTLSPPHCLSSRIRVVGIARRSSSQFSSPHHQSPKQMTRSRRRYPPRHRSSPRRIQISGYFYRCAPRVSPCSSTTLDLRRSQISARTCAQNVERRKFTSRARDRERGSFVQAKSLLRFLDCSRDGKRISASSLHSPLPSFPGI